MPADPRTGLVSDCDTEAVKNELVASIAEFFRIEEDEVREHLNAELLDRGIHVREAWRRADPRTAEEITLFYQETDSYVYDLAADHCNPRRREVWNPVVRRIERRGEPQHVLVYGDGIGTDSLELARRGHNVRYFDVPGITSRFARFRFERAGMASRIRIADDIKRVPSGSLDVVVCIEVLEHVPDAQTVLREMWRTLKCGGIALITASFGTVGSHYPSHLVENVRYEGVFHRVMERIGFANTYYNTRPVNCPMEFTRVAPGVTGGLLRLIFRIRRAAECRVRGCTAWLRSCR
jgi:ubiquinone/menaquinone biosynthesis C-methylase UbiE